MKKILCFLFGHQYRVSRRITPQITELFCNRCKDQFGMHAGVKALIPLDMELFEMHNEILKDKMLNSTPNAQPTDTTKAENTSEPR